MLYMKGKRMLFLIKISLRGLLLSFMFPFVFGNSIVSTIESAIEHTHKLKAKKIDLEIYKKKEEKASAAYKPTVDASVYQVLEQTEFKTRPSTITRSTNYIFSMKQNIYNGHYDTHNINMANTDIAIHSMDYKSIKQTVVYESIMAHLSVLVAKKLLQIQKQLLVQYKSLLTIAENKSLYGDTNEAMELQSRYHQAQLKYLGLQESFELKKFKYTQFTGQSPNDLKPDINIRSSLLIEPQIVDLSQANPQLLKNILEIKKAEYQIERDKSKFLPKLAIELKAYKAEPLAQLTYTTENQYSARLNLSYNLYNGDKDNIDHEINQLEKLKLMVERENLNEDLLAKYTDFYIKYFYANKTTKRIKSYINTEDKKYTQYKKIFQLSSEKTIIDLLLSLTNLYHAKELKLINKHNQMSYYNNLLLLQSKLVLENFK